MPTILKKSALKRAVTKFILQRNLPVSLTPPHYTLPADTETINDIASKLGYVPCNVNFDDLCTQHGGKLGLDFGGNIEEGLSLQFSSLLCDYPNVAFTIFMIPAGPAILDNLWGYIKLKKYHDISSPGNCKWLQYYRNLAEKFRIEYAMHGCYHYQYENPLFSRHTEFAFKNEHQCRRTIRSALDIFSRARLKVYGFRPPGWDLNGDMSLIKVLNELNFAYVAASSIDAGLNAGCPRVSDDYPTLIAGLINFPQNICLDWSLQYITKRIDRLVQINAMISIKAHFADKLLDNSLTTANLDKLRSIFDYLQAEYPETIKFCTLKELSEALQPNLTQSPVEAVTL